MSWLDDIENLKTDSSNDLEEKKASSIPDINIKDRHQTNNIGTPMYISPEQEKHTKYDQKTDIYSLGIMLFEMINNFKTRHERDEKMKDLRKQRIIPDDVAREFPEECTIIQEMTENDATLRPSAQEALTYIEKLLKLNA